MGGKGFGYTPLKWRYIREFKNGKWGEGWMSENPTVVLNESAGVIQYAQTIFEGMKAQRAADSDKIVLFRPYLHAQRFNRSAAVLGMPEVPEEDFVQAVKAVVKANRDRIPPAEEGALYIRPTMFSTQAILGIRPAMEHQFRVFASPVGGYFGADVKSIRMCTSRFDRAARNGTGHVKCGLNYAMSMQAIQDAKDRGFDECLYLDPVSQVYVEEASAANIIFVDANDTLIVPQSDTILPSITRQSIIELAKEYEWVVEERPVHVCELDKMKEAFLCGTAAIITPVRSIFVDRYDKDIVFEGTADGLGRVSKEIADIMFDIKSGYPAAPEGWLEYIEEV